MILLAVVFVSWVVLTLPVAVLMGKCISRGLEPAPAAETVPSLPSQRGASAVERSRPAVQAGRSQA